MVEGGSITIKRPHMLMWKQNAESLYRLAARNTKRGMPELLVSMRELDDDAYEYDEKNYCIYGRYHHKVYQLGNKVRIRVAKANLVARQLDFELVASPDSPNEVPEKKNDKRRRGRRK